MPALLARPMCRLHHPQRSLGHAPHAAGGAAGLGGWLGSVAGLGLGSGGRTEVEVEVEMGDRSSKI
jgi:hypothetical protein